MLKKYIDVLERIDTAKYEGIVIKIVGLTVEASGPQSKIGEVCKIYTSNMKSFVLAQVVGCTQTKIMLMPFGSLLGVGTGSKVEATGYSLSVGVSDNLLGRVLDGLGNPIDDLGELKHDEYYTVDFDPPNPLTRMPIDTPITLGVKAIDGILSVGRGQRVGIFAGSGVGKSTLLGMIARNTNADINVICLIGERGREVKEFIDRDLGPEGLKRSVLIVATSDRPSVVRVLSAQVATSIAEFYRNQGKNVILMMDSLTRYSMAQREVGLSIGEPPVARGYPPSVFSNLPRLLERTGNSDKGSITALYTVLVDGDDMNEPIADTVRGILDGHIVLSRSMANKGHYPAIDILQSISRVMPNIVSSEHMEMARYVNELVSTYRTSEDLINIGAYAKGTNYKIDLAIEKHEDINKFLTQGVMEKFSFDDTKSLLMNLK